MEFTKLETAVLDALAWELEGVAPDLSGQFAESLPGSRRNTGSGLYTEMIVSPRRPAPLTTPTGRFGTVHAMVGDLPDPIAFQIELREGRLLALHGDAYGQDTRAIAFARIPFDQVFTVDDRGRSIEFNPADHMKPSPLLDLHRHNDHQPAPQPVDPPVINVGARPPVQDPTPTALLKAVFGSVEPVGSGPAPDKADQTSLLIGLWVAIAALAIIAWLVFGVSLVFAVVAAVMLGRLVRQPAVLAVIGRAVREGGKFRYRPPQS